MTENPSISRPVDDLADFVSTNDEKTSPSPEELTEALSDGEPVAASGGGAAGGKLDPAVGGDAGAAAPVVPEDWRIFPCQAKSSPKVDKDGYSLCPAKKPLISWKDPAVWSNDPIQLEKWAGQFPGYMQALPTGEINGIWVLDLDIHYDFCVDEADREAHTKALKQCFLEQRSFVPKKLTKEDVEIFSQYCLEHGLETPEVKIEDGIENFKRYCSEHGHEFPKTLTVITPSGGLHLYFIMPIDGTDIRNSAGEILPGVDVRGTGGYVIKPPSMNQDTGKSYEWENPSVPIAEAEQWLVELVTKKKEKSAPSLPVAQAAGPVADVGALGEKIADIWEAKIAEIRSAKKGRRNPTLNENAFCLYGLAKAGKLTKEFIDLALWDAAHAMKSPLPEKEIRDTLASAWKGAGAWPTGAVEVDDGPLPLRRPPEKQAPYPVECLLESAGVARKLAEVTFTPVSLIAAQVLAIMALIVQELYNIVTIRWGVTPASLFMLIIGDSSVGKSEPYKVLKVPIVQAEKLHKARFYKEWDEYVKACEAYEVDKAAKKKKAKSSEDFFKAVEGLEMPKPPVKPFYCLSDFTYEGLYKHLERNRPSANIFTGEGGKVFGGFAFKDENKDKTISALSDIWSDDEIDRARSSEGVDKLYHRRVSSCILIQPDLVRPVFADRHLSGEGYLYRQLITWPEQPKKQFELQSLLTLDEVKKFHERVNYFVTTFPTPKMDPETDEIVFGEITVTEEAQKEQGKFFNSIQDEIQPGEKYELVKGYACKAAEQALRIAGVLAAFHAEPGTPPVVDKPKMTAGINLAAWYLDEILRITQNEIASPELLMGEAVIKFLHDNELDTTSIRQLQKRGPGALRGEKKKILPIIDLLVDHGLLIPLPEGALVWEGDEDRQKKKRVKKAWRVHPQAWDVINGTV